MKVTLIGRMASRKLETWLNTLTPTPTVEHYEEGSGRGLWEFLGWYTGPSLQSLREKIPVGYMFYPTFKEFPCGGAIMVYHGGYD